MAIKRPFKWDTSTTPASFKEMTDTDLEYLSWQFRKRFADRLYAGHYNGSTYEADYRAGSRTNANGVIGNVLGFRDNNTSPFSDLFSIGGEVFDDTKKSMVRNTQLNDDDTTPDPDIPGDTTESAFDNTLATRHSYRALNRIGISSGSGSPKVPSLPSDSNFDSKGYLVWNTSGKYFEIENEVVNIVDTILKDVNTEMLSGDEIGTYRVATTSPGSSWVELNSSADQAFFADSIMTYDNATPASEGTSETLYKLYLNIGQGVTNPHTSTSPLGWDAGTNSYRERDLTLATSTLINDILMPIYTQYNPSEFVSGTSLPGYPLYTINSSSSVDSNYQEVRGTMNNTFYTDSTQRAVYIPVNNTSGTYYKDRYGTGSLTTLTKYFVINFGNSSSYLR